jgi:hypothetical protein
MLPNALAEHTWAANSRIAADRAARIRGSSNADMPAQVAHIRVVYDRVARIQDSSDAGKPGRVAHSPAVHGPAGHNRDLQDRDSSDADKPARMEKPRSRRVFPPADSWAPGALRDTVGLAVSGSAAWPAVAETVAADVPVGAATQNAVQELGEDCCSASGHS